MYKLKVLLADDHESIQRMLSAFLKSKLSFDATSSVTQGASATTIVDAFF
jgi:CheY-like chemotaxis protein